MAGVTVERRAGRKRGGGAVEESSSMAKKRRLSDEEGLEEGDATRVSDSSASEATKGTGQEEERQTTSAQPKAGPATSEKVSNALLYYNIVTTERPGKRRVKASDYVMAGFSSDEEAALYSDGERDEDDDDWGGNPGDLSDDSE